MALEMRPKCEKCNTNLNTDSIAFICSHECTLCWYITEGEIY